jgi:ATP-dependent Clp protease ATP-binding subunit ClpC
MEEGHLTDSFGRRVDFRNVIMIMTSNIGSDLIKGGGPSMVLSNMAGPARRRRREAELPADQWTR